MRRTLFVLIVVILVTFSGCNEHDKAELQTAIHQSVQNKHIYTTASYETYLSALKKAQSVNNNYFASIQAIENAQNNLVSAIDGLEIATKGVYQIHYKFKLCYNDNVGNDWQQSVTYNNQKIDNGDTITAPLHSSVVIKGSVVENDRIPDEGYGTIELILNNTVSTSTNIIVQENRGRYIGNTAIWQWHCSATCLEKI